MGTDVELQTYLRAIRRYWWIIAISAVVGAALGGVVITLSTPQYASTVTFLATTPSTESANPLQGDQFGQSRVNTYVKLLDSERLARRITGSSNLGLSSTDVTKRITGTADLNTVLFTATATDSSAQRSLNLARAVGTEFPALVDEIETQNGTQKATVHLDVVSGPTLQPAPVSPKKKLDVAEGFILGLFVGIAIVLLMAVLDKKVRRADDLRGFTRRPVMSVVPRSRAGVGVLAPGTTAPWAEAFRLLRTNVQFTRDGENTKSFAVVSAGEHDGRTTHAVNLAVTFASAGRSTLLVDADMRSPHVADLLGLKPGPGLSSLLDGETSFEAVLQDRMHGCLTVLPSGPVPDNPAELLSSPRMDELDALVRSRFDVIVFDTPPVSTCSDGIVVAARCDATLVVVRAGRTRRDDLAQTLQELSTVGASVIGTSLNRAAHV
jgi:capsular exopolysaccharide synthesis family protein